MWGITLICHSLIGSLPPSADWVSKMLLTATAMTFSFLIRRSQVRKYNRGRETWLVNTWLLLRRSSRFLRPVHSRPQRPRSFWSAPRIATSGQVQHRNSAHAQSQVWQIWLVLVSIYCVYISIQNQNVIGPGQKSWFLVLTKRSAASGDENAPCLLRRGSNVSHRNPLCGASANQSRTDYPTPPLTSLRS